MSRDAVTVLVTPVDDRRIVERCLQTLRPTLRADDHVVLLEASTAASPRYLRGVEYAVPRAGETLADVAQRIVAETATPLVAELHADVLVTPHWLDRLARALEDPAVAAAAPRSNLAPPGQMVSDAAYGKRHGGTLRDFAREWGDRHHEVTDASGPLSTACRLRRQGASPGRVVVVHAAYVHHEAAKGCPDLSVGPADEARPLLSASMIVKDEQDVLAGALASLKPFCDEIVVYDTGSTDRTREIAAAHGALVIEGYWDEDFGAARNRGLAHCTGRWIVMVDADEVAHGDPEQLRTVLRTTSCEGFLTAITNLGDRGAGSDRQHLGLRVFRRDDGMYDGRLHEQVVHRRLGRLLLGEMTQDLTIEHSGYLSSRIESKDKSQRNLALAQRESEQPSRSGAIVDVNLARSVGISGDPARALALFEQVWSQPLYGYARRNAAMEAGHYALRLGDLDAAHLWVNRLEQAGQTPEPVAVARATVLAQAGEHARALALVEQLPPSYVDADGLKIDTLSVAGLHARLLSQADRHNEAADLLLKALGRGFFDVPLTICLAVMSKARRPLAELVAAVPARLRLTVVGECAALGPEEGDDLLEATWQLEPRTEVLVAASLLAPAMTVRRAMEWAIRLRVAGFEAHCPLVSLAADPSRSVRDRTLAAACAYEHLRDDRAMPLLEAALGEVTDEEAPGLLAELAVLAPALAAAIEPSEPVSLSPV